MFNDQELEELFNNTAGDLIRKLVTEILNQRDIIQEYQSVIIQHHTDFKLVKDLVQSGLSDPFLVNGSVASQALNNINKIVR